MPVTLEFWTNTLRGFTNELAEVDELELMRRFFILWEYYPKGSSLDKDSVSKWKNCINIASVTYRSLVATLSTLEKKEDIFKKLIGATNFNDEYKKVLKITTNDISKIKSVLSRIPQSLLLVYHKQELVELKLKLAYTDRYSADVKDLQRESELEKEIARINLELRS